MSLMVCPLQDVCPKYENGSPARDHFTRTKHVCNGFLAGDCDMGQMVEIFIRTESGETVACSIDKGKEFRK